MDDIFDNVNFDIAEYDGNSNIDKEDELIDLKIGKVFVDNTIIGKVYITEDLLEKFNQICEDIYHSSKDLYEVNLLSYPELSSFQYCSFKSLFECYMKVCSTYKKDKLQDFLICIIRERIHLQFTPSDALYLYEIVRIYNINDYLGFGWNYDRYEMIHLILSIPGYYFEHNVFQLNEKSDQIKYDEYIDLLGKRFEVDPVDFLCVALDLCDFVFLKNYSKKFCNDMIGKYDEYDSFVKKWIVTLMGYIIFSGNCKNSCLERYKSFYSIHSSDLLDNEDKTIIENRSKEVIYLQRLNNECKNFYTIAERLRDVLDNSFIVDYSVVSLQYYKIIEIVLKNILKDSLNDESIDKDYIFKDIADVVGFRKNSNSEYKSNWIEKLTLEKIHHFFKDFFVNHLDSKDYLISRSSKSFINNISKHFVSARAYTYIIGCTQQKALSKYRNPPAHTKPCEKNVASCSKKIMLGLLKLLNN